MKKILCLLLVFTLTIGSATVVHATSIKEAEDKADELKKEKEKVEDEKKTLTENVEKLSKELLEVQDEIAEVYEKIQQAEVDLVVALTVKENQYQDMKTRIRYMYENDSTNSVMELMLSVRSINDFLNKVEYAEQVTAYDRRKLDEYQAVVREIELKQEALDEENTKLQKLQEEVAQKKAEVETMLAKANVTLEELDDQIGDNAKVLAALVKAAEEEAKRQQEASGGTVTGTAGGSVVSGNGMFTHPIPGYTRMSSPFGYRYHPISGQYKLHNGTDYAAPTGTPIYAAMGGTVTISRYSASAGNYISINHGNGLVTIYMHNSALFVKVGDKVTKGQNIGKSGNTGNSTGPHLHFQVMLNGQAVNGMGYL